MATRSSIAIVDTRTKEGKGRVIYCHWDGYLQNNGAILLESYTTPEKINALMDLGDISSLGQDVETTEPHSFDKPHTGVVIAYGRDRGEEGCEAHTFIGKNPASKYSQEFNYLFVIDENKWYVRNSYFSNKYIELTTEMCQDED